MVLKKDILLLIFFFACSSLLGQENGKLFIQIYNDTEYGGTRQNWCIHEDKRGVIYVANQAGFILEFDGTYWRSIPIDNIASIRSLAIDKNEIIYVGGTDEFGYLAPDLTGNMKYNSLLFLVDSSDREFGEIWSINTLKNKMFFQARNSLFIYENNQIKHWNLPNTYHRGFSIQGNYYIRQEGIGLTLFKNDTLELINDGEIFENKLISAMVDYSNNKIAC